MLPRPTSLRLLQHPRSRLRPAFVDCLVLTHSGDRPALSQYRWYRPGCWAVSLLVRVLCHSHSQIFRWRNPDPGPAAPRRSFTPPRDEQRLPFCHTHIGGDNGHLGNTNYFLISEAQAILSARPCDTPLIHQPPLRAGRLTTTPHRHRDPCVAARRLNPNLSSRRASPTTTPARKPAARYKRSRRRYYSIGGSTEPASSGSNPLLSAPVWS